ncbi:MAG: hypothetical protein HYV09_35860 [Deltaproteobacteria bacterium]|nr:hypothetical protein [Deltaproteobacteria bacterium]
MTTDPTRMQRRAQLVTAAAASLTALVAVGAAVATWRLIRPATWVDITATEHACRADRIAAECTITNATPEPVKTCLRVRLTRKAGGDEVSSVNMCPGRLDAYESRTVRAVWGKAVERACSSERAGAWALDFEACDMRIESGGH